MYVYINFSSCESAREASTVANRTINDVRLTVTAAVGREARLASDKR